MFKKNNNWFAFSKIGKMFYAWNKAAEIEGEVIKTDGKAKKRTRDELQFMPAALEVLETPPSPTARLTLWGIIIVFITAIALATIGKNDVVVTAEGQIMPSSRRKVIQPLESAVVQAIHVTEGQKVQEGELLVELNPVEGNAEKRRIGDGFDQAQLEVTRLKALIALLDGKANSAADAFTAPEGTSESMAAQQLALLNSQISQFRAERSALDATIRQEQSNIRSIEADLDRMRSILPMIRQRVEGRRELAKKGLAPRLQVLELEQELTDVSKQLNIQRSQKARSIAALDNARQQRRSMASDFKRQRLTELTEAEAKMASLSQEVIKINQKVSRFQMHAPVTGLVQELKINTVGGVVTPAQELMFIVPEGDKLEVRALLPNKDRGAVKSGDDAAVKVAAFPFTRFGTIPAEVDFVSGDAIQDEKLGPVFAIEAILERDYIIDEDGDRVKLSPGMAVSLEIKTDERRIISYILTPIIKGFKEAARER